ncbi:MAG: cytochrome c551 [Bacillota bacterium]|uniref:C-type cytochrome n=1 Tax=Virgibacillus salarius TaxID=447199 RepID=A0A941DZ07_9BACI|nr:MULTISPECIES: cytochrome c [Virgibacillus]NAZ10394.1 c-type cytochrome [Agaribacter marinus]MBR7797684.1 c-type cytochrome [Virgibacillus salarius]MCC2251059.1 c-type cytochrome [Virgibacillus sp. AGTR]MDY7042881.1 c-type cytochrome [Virgibacillus sp. M23]QRZ18027.1 c-type cytochrome [Virgibacillus sp. AGTR]
MKKWLLTMLFGTALVLGACGGGDDNASEEPADNGDTGTEEPSDSEGGAVDTAAAEDVFKSNCASCHGADLSGGNGPDLTQVGSKLSSDEIADIIKNGKGSMPAGMASGDDVQLLADWLAQKK